MQMSHIVNRHFTTGEGPEHVKKKKITPNIPICIMRDGRRGAFADIFCISFTF